MEASSPCRQGLTMQQKKNKKTVFQQLVPLVFGQWSHVLCTREKEWRLLHDKRRKTDIYLAQFYFIKCIIRNSILTCTTHFCNTNLSCVWTIFPRVKLLQTNLAAAQLCARRNRWVSLTRWSKNIPNDGLKSVGGKTCWPTSVKADKGPVNGGEETVSQVLYPMIG